MNRKAIIIGAGSYGQTFSYYLEEAGFEVYGFIDDNPTTHGKTVLDKKVLGDMNHLITEKKKFQNYDIYCPLGDNTIRSNYLAQLLELGFKTPGFIHATCILPDTIELGLAVYMLPGVKIMPFTRIDNYVMLSMGCHVAHHTHLKEGVFISTGANIGAGITMGERAFAGIGSTVTTGVKYIGNDAVLGSGTVVIRDVEPLQVVAGVPGKVLKTLEKKK